MKEFIVGFIQGTLFTTSIWLVILAVDYVIGLFKRR